jgi:hypothetical protein
MDINPTSPDGARSKDSQRLETHRPKEAREVDLPRTPRRSAGEAAPADSVNVSSEAKDLARGSESGPPRTSLSAERLTELGRRLATGHYDQPEVLDRVARRVAEDELFHRER